MKLLVLTLLAAASLLTGADFTGRWSGALGFTTPDGPREEPVLLILKQDGSKITGTGGRDINDRHEVISSKIEGNQVELQVEAGDRPVSLKLTLTGDDLTGEASRVRGDGSSMTAKFTAKRVKDAK